MMIKNILALCLCISSIGHAAPITVFLHGTDDSNINYGTLVFNDSSYGLVITPHLTQLPPGAHGFHLDVYQLTLQAKFARVTSRLCI
jgi:Cu-Zn family superoxide dismutase